MASPPSYDLTATLAAHLDPHMILPLLDFAEANGVFDRSALNRARLQILQKTQMVDFFNDIVADEFNGAAPDGLQPRSRDAVVAQYGALRTRCAPLLALLDERKGDLGDRAHMTAAALREQRQVEPAQVDALYAYAKFLFDCGQYQDAAEALFCFRILSGDDARSFKALWGQLAADILLTHWDDALVGLTQLSDAIDAMAATATPLSLVQYRTWLIHWGLFVFFNHPNGRASLIDFLNKERNLVTIQTSCPHVLRYVVTACVIRRRRNALLDLVKLVSKLAYLYSDPITQFVLALYVDYDFATAFAKLGECERVLSDDFFLSYIKDEFIDSARLFYFETFFRAHQTISIAQVAASLGVGIEDAERWTVDLIRSLGLEARIDLHKNEVVMSKEFPSVYQSVIDKTKSLTFRTNQLVSLVDKKYLSLQE